MPVYWSRRKDFRGTTSARCLDAEDELAERAHGLGRAESRGRLVQRGLADCARVVVKRLASRLSCQPELADEEALEFCAVVLHRLPRITDLDGVGVCGIDRVTEAIPHFEPGKRRGSPAPDGHAERVPERL